MDDSNYVYLYFFVEGGGEAPWKAGGFAIWIQIFPPQVIAFNVAIFQDYANGDIGSTLQNYQNFSHFHWDPIFLSFVGSPLSIANFTVNNIIKLRTKRKILNILYRLQSDSVNIVLIHFYFKLLIITVLTVFL